MVPGPAFQYVPYGGYGRVRRTPYILGLNGHRQVSLREYTCMPGVGIVHTCRWPGDLAGAGQEIEPLKSADARREFWVLWRSFG